MTASHPIHEAQVPTRFVYIIHSADFSSEGASFVRDMERRAAPFPELVLTEDDDQYDYQYLAKDDESSVYWDGMHRKWAGELSWERWLEFAKAYLIDLDDDGMPEHYSDTMGTITELGHIPAVSVDDTEGWGYGEVIDSNVYVSISELV
jgi:hypothetical protein